MFEALALARGDGRHERIVKTIARMEVMIIDDCGPTDLTAPERRNLLQIPKDCHGLDNRHQPTARRTLARSHRRPNLGRRHPQPRSPWGLNQ